MSNRLIMYLVECCPNDHYAFTKPFYPSWSLDLVSIWLKKITYYVGKIWINDTPCKNDSLNWNVDFYLKHMMWGKEQKVTHHCENIDTTYCSISILDHNLLEKWYQLGHLYPTTSNKNDLLIISMMLKSKYHDIGYTVQM